MCSEAYPEPAFLKRTVVGSRNTSLGGSLKRMKLSVRAGQSVALSFSAHRCDVHQHSRFYTSSVPEQTFPAAWPAASAMELRKQDWETFCRQNLLRKCY